MSKLRVFNGASLLKDYVLDLYPYALQYYGEQYKSIIDDTLDHVVLYDWNNENPHEIIEELMGRIVTKDEIGDINPNQSDYRGFHFLCDAIPNKVDHVIVVKNKGTDDDKKAVIAHEIYGHAVCGHNPTHVIVNGERSERNGISIVDSDILLNNLANEGIIEYIARSIMALYNPKYGKSNYIQAYVEGVALAEQLFKYIGKEKMLELMVYYKHNINDLFDVNDKSSWNKLAADLDKGKDIDEHIDSFIKRYKYNK